MFCLPWLSLWASSEGPSGAGDGDERIDLRGGVDGGSGAHLEGDDCAECGRALSSPPPCSDERMVWPVPQMTSCSSDLTSRRYILKAWSIGSPVPHTTLTLLLSMASTTHCAARDAGKVAEMPRYLRAHGILSWHPVCVDQ